MAEAVTLTQEEVDAELKGRVDQFNKELVPLLGKYELGLGATALVQPNGTIGARPVMFDDRKKGEESDAEAPAEEKASAITEG